MIKCRGMILDHYDGGEEKKSVHHDLPPLITEEIVTKVGDSGKISREKETALVPLLAKQWDEVRRRRRRGKKNTRYDVLFKKAMNKLWRSAMHVNRAVTLVHCQRLKEGKKTKHDLRRIYPDVRSSSVTDICES